MPELSYLTGISERMRNNYKAMKEIAQVTKPDPWNRIYKLREFVRSIESSPEAKAEMHNWGVYLPPDPLNVSWFICSYRF